MRLVSAFTFAALLIGTGIATAQDVRYNFDKSRNFSEFKTYAWVKIKDAATLSDLADRQVKDAIDAELAKKGLTKLDSPDTADLLIGYQAGVGQEKEMTTYNTGWGYGPGWGGWYGGGGGITTSQTSTIYIGQLAVDMYCAKAKTLVWRGMASKTIDPNAKPEKRQKNLAKAMTKLFKNYPPVEKK